MFFRAAGSGHEKLIRNQKFEKNLHGIFSHSVHKTDFRGDIVSGHCGQYKNVDLFSEIVFNPYEYSK
jgi:hypothetical protein